MSSPDPPFPPRSPGFYIFRSNSSIPPPEPPPPRDSLLTDVLPHVLKQSMRSITAVTLPVILLPLHFFFLVLSIITTVLAGAFLSWRAFMVYVDIALDTFMQVYEDYVLGTKETGRRRRELLKKVVLEREDAVKMQAERPQARGRGLTIT